MVPTYFLNKYWYKPCTERSVLKRERRFKLRVESGRYVGKEKLTAARNSLFKMKLKRNATPSEVLLGDWMWANGVYFKFQKGFFKPFHRICDFYLPEKRLIIEVDGGYHINTVQKDYIKDTLWDSERGYKTIRIKNEQVFSGEFARILIQALK